MCCSWGRDCRPEWLRLLFSMHSLRAGGQLRRDCSQLELPRWLLGRLQSFRCRWALPCTSVHDFRVILAFRCRVGMMCVTNLQTSLVSLMTSRWIPISIEVTMYNPCIVGLTDWRLMLENTILVMVFYCLGERLRHSTLPETTYFHPHWNQLIKPTFYSLYELSLGSTQLRRHW